MTPKNPRAADHCATRLKVLADETRLKVVRLLMKGPQHVGELNLSLGLDQSLMSHHLKVLREAGFVMSRRDGKAVLYRLKPDIEYGQSGQTINLGCCQISF